MWLLGCITAQNYTVQRVGTGVDIISRVVVWPFGEKKTHANEFICFAWIAEISAKEEANVRMTHHHSRSNHFSDIIFII